MADDASAAIPPIEDEDEVAPAALKLNEDDVASAPAASDAASAPDPSDVAPAPTAPPAKLTKKAAAAAAKAAKKPPDRPFRLNRLILKAVAASEDRRGVSLVVLKKALVAGGYDMEKNERHVKIGLMSLVKKGTLLQTKGSSATGTFKLNKKAIQKEKTAAIRLAIAKKSPKKEVVKKPATVKKTPVKKVAPVKKSPKKVPAKKPAAIKKSPKKAKKPAAAKEPAKSPKKVKKPAASKKVPAKKAAKSKAAKPKKAATKKK